MDEQETHSENEFHGYDSKQTNIEAPVRIWRMLSTFFIATASGQLWPRLEAPYRVLSMGQIEMFDHLKQ